jgi:hypothetical protein
MAVVLCARTELELTYQKRAKSDTLTLSLVAPLGFVLYRKEMPVLDVKRGGWRVELEPTFMETYRSLTFRYGPVLRFLLDRAEVRSLTWQTTIGAGDAALTAFLSGVTWSVKGTLLALLQSRTRAGTEDVAIAVSPSYSGKEFKTFLQCIFCLRVAHIMYAQCLLLWRRRKHRKGAVSELGESSYSGTDENRHGEHQRHGGR